MSVRPYLSFARADASLGQMDEAHCSPPDQRPGFTASVRSESRDVKSEYSLFHEQISEGIP